MRIARKKETELIYFSSTHDSRCGTALLLTLIIIAIVASSLVVLTNQSFQAQLAASSAEKNLQMRWAQQSIQKTCLDNAEILLSAQPDTLSTSSTPWIPITIRGIEFSVRVGDEQSKLNVSTRLYDSSVEQVATMLRSLAPDARVDLTGIRFAKAHGDADVGLGAFEQVWVGVEPESLFGDTDDLGFTKHLTLWGDGKINLSRVSEDTAVQMFKGVLTRSETTALLRLQSDNTSLSPVEVLSLLDASNDQKELLTKQLAPMSRCHSVLIRFDQYEHRSSWRLAVQQLADVTKKENDSATSQGDTRTEQRVWVQLW